MVHLFKYVRGTKYLPLILSVDKSGMLKWYIVGLHAVNPNMRGHTGGGLTMGRGLPILVSRKQKLNTRSSTKSEIVGVDQLMPSVLWNRIFKNIRDMDLLRISYTKTIEKNGKSPSSKHTKHINIIHFSVTDRIHKGDMAVEW